MRQIFFGGTNDAINSAATEYVAFNGQQGNTWNATHTLRQQMVAGTGIFHSLKMTLDAAPGGGGTYTFNLRKNNATTGVSVAITDPATDGKDTFNEASFTPGDLIDLECVPSGSPSNTPIAKWSAIYEDATSPERTVIIGGHNDPLNATTNEFNYISGGATWGTISPGTIGPTVTIPIAGVLRDFYVDLSGTPGTGASYTFNTATPTTPTSLGITISGTATTGSDTSNTDAVSADAVRTIRCAPSGSPSVRRARWGFIFTDDNREKWIILGGSTDNLHNSATEYNNINITDSPWNGTVTNRELLIAECCTLSNLHVVLNASPGIGKSYQFTIMKNGSATSLQATVSDLTFNAADDTNTVEFAEGDLISFQVVPSGTPTITQARWGVAARSGLPFPNSLKQVGIGI